MISPKPMRGAMRRARRIVASGVESTFGMVLPMSRSPLHREGLPAPVTNALFSRIEVDDFEALSPRLSDEDRAYWTQLEPGSVNWKRTALHYSVRYGLDGSWARAGLTAAEPPSDVHAMGRGSLAAGGSIYHSDLVFGALELAGVEIPARGRVLDFGCSSGRVIRVVKAYRPDLECHGCDPNEGAIRWANENLPDISFMVSPQRPPLASGESSFDCVFAISIWSHFGPEAATAWLAEMHRLLTPGGLLMLTTHSFGSVAYYASKRLRSVVDMRAVLTSMLGTGFGFLQMFGTKGDWGVIDPDWGEAYISPEWLLNRATPQWDVLLYRTRANEDNQDVVILRRRDIGSP